MIKHTADYIYQLIRPARPLLERLRLVNRIAPTWILVETNDIIAGDGILAEWYTFITQLSYHDRLYRAII